MNVSLARRNSSLSDLATVVTLALRCVPILSVFPHPLQGGGRHSAPKFWVAIALFEIPPIGFRLARPSAAEQRRHIPEGSRRNQRFAAA